MVCWALVGLRRSGGAKADLALTLSRRGGRLPLNGSLWTPCVRRRPTLCQVRTRRNVFLAVVAVGTLLTTGGACGGDFHQTNRVVSTTPTKVCVTRVDGKVKPDGSRWIDCFDPRSVGTDETFEVGQCVRTARRAESATITGATSSACPK